MMKRGFQADIAAIDRIKAVPSILDVVCRTTGMGFAAVARVTEDRWIACGVHDEIGFGLTPGGELNVETTICHEIRQSRKAVVIDDVADDPYFCGHVTPATYGFKSYISVPIMLSDGRFFGTLCAIDPRPARVNTPETIGMFTLFAELIAFHLDAIDRLASSELRLTEEQATSELREQFIAVLGHDLRDPLSAIDAGVSLLRQTPLSSKAANVVDLIHDSVARMSRLIKNMLDLAQGRLTDGLTVDRKADTPLKPALYQVIAELQANWPDRVIEATLDFGDPIDCDGGRIAQLLSNLLSNALKYGAPDQPVRVQAKIEDRVFALSVANQGDPIPAFMLDRLFQPFYRGAAKPNSQGLGLGLYISSEIARAHGGVLNVFSSADETRFAFEMPLS